MSPSTPTKKKVLLIGMGIELGKEGREQMKKDMATDFPEHEIRIVTGLFFANEFTIESTDDLPGQYI